MTQGGVRAWLPKGAFSLQAVGQCLSEPLAAWSARWFVRGAVAVAAVHGEDAASHPPAPHSVTVDGAHAALELSGRGKRRLLEAALDTDLAERPLSDGDRRLLDGFARTILDDLAVRVEGMFEAPADGDAADRIVCTITLGTSDVLTVSVASADLVPLLKKRAPAAQASTAATVRRSEALRRTKLDMHGFLGRAEIAMHELKELAAGDILVLDRKLTEPVELRLSDSGAALARGRLCQDANQFSIQL